jgi:predicted alpha/beta-hydrolase family hydrolase
MELFIQGPKRAKKKFILAHGAGAPMDSDWMNDLTDKLVERKIQVARFEFPYMRERRENGKKRPPNRAPVLIESWHEAIKEFGTAKDKIAIGGKSMGGRIASLVTQEELFGGLICLGFPFHAPGKPMKEERYQQLFKTKTPTLIVQGERDSMGTQEEVSALKLARKVKTHFLPDGDHSLKPRVKSGYSLDQHLETSADLIDQFLTKQLG